MALGMSSGQGVPFYDPFYSANSYRSSPGRTSGAEDSHSRGHCDDFSVFNSVHITKPQSLSLNTPPGYWGLDFPSRAMPQVVKSEVRPGTEETLTGKEILSTPVKTGQDMLSTSSKAVEEEELVSEPVSIAKTGLVGSL